MEGQRIIEEPSIWNQPFTVVFQFLAAYGWWIVGSGAALAYAWNRFQPSLQRWREAREEAEYHKDPDRALGRELAVQKAREKQQQLLEEASLRATEAAKERAEKRRAENVARLQNYTADGGNRLGTDQDYLPLSGGASTSSYRAPKRSACSQGGCGR